MTPEQERYVLGPPFHDSLPAIVGPGRVAPVIASYREYYADDGMFDTTAYPGIGELLDWLAAGGITLAVATSKPEPFAGPIVHRLGFEALFRTVCGDTLAGERGSKALVVGEALRRLGHPDPATVVMIGDRRHDVSGAAAHGVRCYGAGWVTVRPGSWRSRARSWSARAQVSCARNWRRCSVRSARSTRSTRWIQWRRAKDGCDTADCPVPHRVSAPACWPWACSPSRVVFAVLYKVGNSGEDHSYNDGGRPPTNVHVTLGRNYEISTPGGVPATIARDGNATTLNCNYTPVIGTSTQQLTTTPLGAGTRTTHAVATFVAPVTGLIHVECRGLASTYIDDADDVSGDPAGLFLLLCIITLSAGAMFGLSALYRRSTDRTPPVAPAAAVDGPYRGLLAGPDDQEN